MTPEDHLARALKAKSGKARGNHARRGLACAGDERRDELHPTTHTMLLRQLYLSHYAASRFEDAYDVACQAVTIGALPDVLHQDAARAAQALGNVDEAVGHLRLAARVAPPNRRAFHWWTLGSVLFLAQRHDEAIDALRRASRWGTNDKPLYRGHLALAKCHAGKQVRGLAKVIRQLDECPAGQGYGRFVLGQLAALQDRPDDARRYLEAFVRRTTKGRDSMRIALSAELEMARATLDGLNSN